MKRLVPTAALLALPFAAMTVPAPAAAHTTIVSNCNDSGPGSLRSAVASAANGSTVDARALSCPTISLAGQIPVPQSDLTILGNSRHRIVIDGNFAGRIFEHTGNGTLRLQHLWLVRGREYVQTALGGCIRSRGNVELRYVHMHACLAEGRRPPDYDGVGAGAFAGGGGIHAAGDVTLVFSQIHGSSASTFTGYGGAIASYAMVRLYGSRVSGSNAHDGGGISAHAVHASYSLIDHNSATDYGGIRAANDVFLLRTTVADNDAMEHCGGLCVGGRSTIVDSTLSRNGASSASAAAFSAAAAIYNSTVAANRQGTDSPGCGAAIDAAVSLHLHSSIVASNDCRDGNRMVDIASGTSISGSHNIVRAANVPLPADTIHANPRLHPLADNGGPTPTMALLEASPAIDRGSNALGLSYDQRGSGYPRAKGSRTDIGAFER